MIITLPISHLINKDNINEIECIDTYQFRNVKDLMEFDEHKKVSKYQSIIFHDNIGIVRHDFIDRFKDKAFEFINHNIDLYSTNLAPACEMSTLITGNGFEWYHADSEILSREKIKELVKEKVKRISPFADRIALENSNRYGKPAYIHICNPKFMTEVINETDAWFCLDIAHAIVSYNTWFSSDYDSIESFIRTYPLHRCEEIHLSTPEKKENSYPQFTDKHLKPDDKIFELLDMVLSKVNGLYGDPYVAIEYYGDFEGIKESYKRLEEM